MKFEVSFTPPSETVIPGKFRFFAQLHYQIFPEMMEEFGENAFKTTELIPLEVDKIDDTHDEYFLELERPYGECTANVFFVEIEAQELSDTPIEPTELQRPLLEYYSERRIPLPISVAQQKELDDQEEKDNKDNERKARQAQKELETRKAK